MRPPRELRWRPSSAPKRLALRLPPRSRPRFPLPRRGFSLAFRGPGVPTCAHQPLPSHSLPTERLPWPLLDSCAGRPASHRATISASKSYNVQRDWVFEPKVFTELKNMQAVVLAYDGLNPQPPTYCYLKPYYLNPSWTYFDQVAAGAL